MHSGNTRTLVYWAHSVDSSCSCSRDFSPLTAGKQCHVSVSQGAWNSKRSQMIETMMTNWACQPVSICAFLPDCWWDCGPNISWTFNANKQLDMQEATKILILWKDSQWNDLDWYVSTCIHVVYSHVIKQLMISRWALAFCGCMYLLSEKSLLCPKCNTLATDGQISTTRFGQITFNLLDNVMQCMYMTA